MGRVRNYQWGHNQHKVFNRVLMSGEGWVDNQGTNSFLSNSEFLASIQARTMQDASSVSYFTQISNSVKKRKVLNDTQGRSNSS